LWDVVTKEFVGDSEGNLRAVKCKKVAWKRLDGEWKMEEMPDSEFELKAELVTLAMGFVHPVYQGMLHDFDISLDPRGNVDTETEGDKAYHTNIDGVFSAGDMRRGQSLVVWAIREGRQCADSVDRYLRENNSISE
jgi:glutamate synthase (NADPH/NADH) small chain